MMQFHFGNFYDKFFVILFHACHWFTEPMKRGMTFIINKKKCLSQKSPLFIFYKRLQEYFRMPVHSWETLLNFLLVDFGFTKKIKLWIKSYIFYYFNYLWGLLLWKKMAEMPCRRKKSRIGYEVLKSDDILQIKYLFQLEKIVQKR